MSQWSDQQEIEEGAERKRLKQENEVYYNLVTRLYFELWQQAATFDIGACDHYARTGSFSHFDEPSAVARARRLLTLIETAGASYDASSIIHTNTSR